MKRIYGILCVIILTALLASGCGSSDDKSPADSTVKKQTTSIVKKEANVMEEYVNGLTNAKSSDDVVNTIDNYTKGMKELIPDLMEFQKKYPEFKEGKVPEGMEVDIKKVEEMSAKIPGAMMKLTQYMMDSKVQEAMTRMGEELGKLEQ